VFKKFILLSLIVVFSNSNANTVGSETGLEVPRFVSLKSNDSNVRVGPSKNYPIKIKYIVKNFPLKITEEYRDWRKIEDFQNNSGWVHKSLIKGERNGIVTSNTNDKINLYNTIDGKLIGEIQINTLVFIIKCKTNWCLISKNSRKGWLKKSNIWGVKKNETFNVNFFQPISEYYFKSVNIIETKFFK
tara:strand:- start:32 stop:595 length:564 start_codon:yes stop_codon:yes gene_type:complete